MSIFSVLIIEIPRYVSFSKLIILISITKTSSGILRLNKRNKKIWNGIILDNCQIYLSKLVQNYAVKILASFYFISTNAIELTYIETYFSRIKSTVIREFKLCEINLTSLKGMDFVSKVLQNIREEIYNYCGKLYSTNKRRIKVNYNLGR